MDGALSTYGGRGVARLVAGGGRSDTQSAADVLVSAGAQSPLVYPLFWHAPDRSCPGGNRDVAACHSDLHIFVLADRPRCGDVDAALYCLGLVCYGSERVTVDPESILTVLQNNGIQLERVCKAYEEAGQDRVVLDQLSLHAKAGEFISVRGPSGSGKSTLLHILGGIDLADSGSVNVGGQELTQMGETARTLFRRHHIGFVFQFFNLVPTLTVAENLRLPLQLCKKYRSDNDIDRWLERFDLADRAGSYPDVLSGGEQQRIAIIRAAIHQPVLILADEPTGNLDGNAGEGVLNILRDVVEQGACVVMATHSREAANASDRQLVLRGGELQPEAKA